MTSATMPPIASGARPWIAALLSLVLPGLGQAYAGRHLRGLAWFSPAVILAAGAFVLIDAEIADLIGAALSPVVLWGVFWLNVLGAAWRIGAAVDAFALVNRESPVMVMVMTFAVGWLLLLLFATTPHLVIGRYTLDAISLVSTVFVAEEGSRAIVPLFPIGTDADIVPDPALTPNVVDSGPVSHSRVDPRAWDPDAIAAWIKIKGDRRGSADAPFLPFNERLGKGRVNVLIAGGDSGPGRGGLRTDTMIVASMHMKTGRAAVFSFPRNLGSIPLPEEFESAFEDLERSLAPDPVPLLDGEAPPEWESCKCFPGQMNAIYSHTRRWTHTYPHEVDPGMADLRDVVAGLMGVNIDYYVLLDMGAFVDLVDAIGGVDVYVLQPLHSEVSPPREGDAWAVVDVDVGWNHLDGPQALAYVRARKGASDYARMQRQRCMVRAVAAKADPFTVMRSFPAIVDAVAKSVVTDLPRSFVADFIAAAANLDFDDIQTVGFTHAYWQEARDHLGHPVPDVEKIQAKVRRVFAGFDTDLPGDVGASECDA